MRNLRQLLFFIMLLVIVVILFGCKTKKAGETIVFGDVSWNSVKVHNRIMGFIIEKGLVGYKAEYFAGDTVPVIRGIIQGHIDVDMESWHSNISEIYKQGIDSGDMVDLGKNLPDAPQGWWVPRYLVEGDNALAPDLKSVEDLLKYSHLFKDIEYLKYSHVFKDSKESSKGVIYGGVSGWGQVDLSKKFFEKFKLGEKFNFKVVDSGAALAKNMIGAYKTKNAWCGYYWAPTAILGKYDMVRLKGSEYPSAKVNILVNKSMLEKAPDIVEILKKYSTTVEDNNEFLAKMDDNKWDPNQTAIWFLKNKEKIWTKWVSAEVAKKVKLAL